MWDKFVAWVETQESRINRPNKTVMEEIVVALYKGRSRPLQSIVYVPSPFAMVEFLKKKEVAVPKSNHEHLDQAIHQWDLHILSFAGSPANHSIGSIDRGYRMSGWRGEVLRFIRLSATDYETQCWYDWMSNTQKWRYHAVFHKIYNRFLFIKQHEHIETIMTVCENVLSWFLGDDFCVLCEHPTQIHFNDRGQLHCENGPAIRFADNWSVYAINGISVSEKFIADLQHLTVEQIDNQPNAELKRIMLMHYGLARYIQETGATKISEDAYGTLYRKSLGQDFQQDVLAVHVTCSTTERPYWLSVPMISELTGKPITTAHEAVAWTFGLRKEEYLPDQES